MSTWVVVGANRGIGLEMVRLLRKRGETVIAACRTSTSELDALGAEVVSGIDVTSEAAVKSLAERVGNRTIDVLVAMAGILRRTELDALDFDEIRKQLEVNALGPLRIAAALRPRLGAGSKLALITSRMGSIADNDSGGYYAYRMSKAALNAAGKSLAVDLKPRGVAVALLHPGFVRTDMTGGHGDVGPDVAALRLIERIDALSIETSGSFFHANGTALPW